MHQSLTPVATPRLPPHRPWKHAAIVAASLEKLREDVRRQRRHDEIAQRRRTLCRALPLIIGLGVLLLGLI